VIPVNLRSLRGRDIQPTECQIREKRNVRGKRNRMKNRRPKKRGGKSNLSMRMNPSPEVNPF
jgi:hypothetical protein